MAVSSSVSSTLPPRADLALKSNLGPHPTRTSWKVLIGIGQVVGPGHEGIELPVGDLVTHQPEGFDGGRARRLVCVTLAIAHDEVTGGDRRQAQASPQSLFVLQRRFGLLLHPPGPPCAVVMTEALPGEGREGPHDVTSQPVRITGVI